MSDNLSNSPFASTPFSTTTTTGSGLFGFSCPAVTSTTNNQSQASFFNVSINNNYFGISSMTASSEGKSGNSTSRPATSVFGSSWEPEKSSGFGTTFNFGASPVVFGASSSGGFSYGTGATWSFSTPTQNQSPFGTPCPVFATPNNNDHMSMDSMDEDSMQTPTPVQAFGQTPVAAPGFMFASTTPSPAMPSFQFGSQIPTPASSTLFNLVASQTKHRLRILSSRLVPSLMLEVGASH